MGPETRRLRRLGLLLGSLAAVAAATLALAGAATAHHHGNHDAGEPAGTIASFDNETGVLTIDLGSGGQISGLVTKFTWIENNSDQGNPCGSDHDRRQLGRWCRQADFRRHHHHHGGWNHSGDTSDLVPGATVQDAFLMLKDGQVWFAKVELAG